MATKTISVDMKAYQKLKRARRSPDESFSQVIHRAVWPDPGKTCDAFLELVERLPPLSKAAIRALEKAQGDDRPPEDPWKGN